MRMRSIGFMPELYHCAESVPMGSQPHGITLGGSYMDDDRHCSADHAGNIYGCGLESPGEQGGDNPFREAEPSTRYSALRASQQWVARCVGRKADEVQVEVRHEGAKG